MNLKKNFCKRLINKLGRVFLGVVKGTYFTRGFTNYLVNKQVRVQHKDVELIFSAPNELCVYRAETFSTKEPDTLTWLETIPESGVFWDVGANVGLYSIYAAKKRTAHVYAFEPSVFNLEFLARNIYLNRLQNRITIVPIALSDATGKSLFKMTNTSWGGALSTFGQDFDQHGDSLQSVFEYQTLGLRMIDVVEKLGVPMPTHIKIDVDGIEHFILRGGAEVLSQIQSVLIELDDNFTDQAIESVKHLEAAGLSLYRKCSLNASGQFNQWWVRKD
ncbi:FkbM family methyltransferase [Methylophilus sp. TWE2]|uniref:FkbM family methyltransferase n=1 Tax=Methylophilus sp. TWE2 TaxID=1662285 RepID=UPI0009E59872|nr:FkbM family methyltransferase [Methylophilus sp. TWE2]